MAQLQESVVLTDILVSGGEAELGLETLARAACNVNPNMRYDFMKYRHPWTARKDTPEVVAIRESWARQGGCVATQGDDPDPPTKQGRKRAAASKAKSAAKRGPVLPRP